MTISSLGMPDMASISMAMAPVNDNGTVSDVGVAMLSKSLSTMQASGAELAKMMELSVNPSIGANFDMSV